MFRTILAPYDLSAPSKRALEVSLQLGAHCGAKLEVTHVVFQNERVSLTDGSQFSKRLLAHLQGEIEKDLKRLSKRGAKGRKPIAVSVTDGETVPALLKAIASRRPDLVTLGTHGRTGLSHVLLGSVAEKILRYSPCPVWIVRRKGRLPLKRVLVPIDLDDRGEEALAYAAGLTRLFPKLTVDLLHVIQFSDMVGYFPEPFSGHAAVNVADLEKEARRRLNRIAKKYPKLRIRTQLRVGRTAPEIRQAAKANKSDLVLLSTHGRRGLNHLLMGSVAEQVIRYVPCDVLSFCPKKSVSHRLKFIKNIRTD